MATDEKTVVDAPTDDFSVEEALDFAEAMRLDENHAGNSEIRGRAEREVMACLNQAENGWSSRYTKFSKLLRLWDQESLSPQAADMSVHMGTAYQKVEEWAGKMYGSMFGQAGEYVGGECEDIEDEEEKEVLVALVQEILDDEAKLRADGLSILREAAIFGNAISKFVPEHEVKWVTTREVKSVESPRQDGTVIYRFSKPERKERVRLRMRRRDVAPVDFRIPDTASSIEDADWCGDYSYPTPEEVRAKIRMGDYDATAAEEALKWVESRMERSARAEMGPLHQTMRSVGGDNLSLGDAPDASPTASQLACFEWWGMFDIDGNGRREPCVITVLVPASDNKPMLNVTTQTAGRVVRVTRNPYYSAHKPYARVPVVRKANRFWGPGIVELVGKHSYYEDEMAVLALLGMYLEASPTLTYSDRAGVDSTELDGFLPGKKIPVEQTGEMEYLTHPARSQHTLNTMEFFAGKAVDVAGLQGSRPQPRVAAAANIMEAQEQDQRLLSYITEVEQSYLCRMAEMAYSYSQQFLTTERKIRILGMKASRLGDMRIVNPTQLAMDLRFEPTVGKRLTQKAFQGQMLMNFYDRAQAANMMGIQTGQGPLYKMDAIGEFLLGDVFGHPDPSRFMHTQVDPMELRTVAEEHRLFAMGERPTVQKGEKVYKHLMGHIDFLRSGGTEDWGEEARQALVNHVYDTVDEFHRQTEAALPDQADIVAMLYQKQLMDAGLVPTDVGQAGKFGQGQGQGQGGAAGGRGVAGPGQSVGSPLFRPERPPGIQAASMSQSPNLGAM